MSNRIYDVLVVGGGPAGLAAATGLARQLYTTVIFDSGVYRNARTKHMHNVPGWDHQDPAAFRAKARQDLLNRYRDTVSFKDVGVKSVAKINVADTNNPKESVSEVGDAAFELTDDHGTIWKGRKVVLATGVRDVYPAEIPGYDEVWARGVFHCLFCHGFEERGAESAGVLALENMLMNGSVGPVLHVAHMARRLARSVVIYTNDNDEIAESLQTAIKPGFDMSIERRKITRLEKGTNHEAEVLVHLEGGEVQVQGFITHRPRMEVNGPFVEQLGLEMTEWGDIKVGQPFCETSVAGVFAAGDNAIMIKSVSQALMMGGMAAGGLSAQLGLIPPSKSEPVVA